MADAICRWRRNEKIDFIPGSGAWTLGIVICMQELCEELDLLSDVYDSERTMPEVFE